MSDTSNVLKAPAGARYDRGWCEPDTRGPQQCIDKSVRVPQKQPKRPTRDDRFVRDVNPSKSPAWRARQVAQLSAVAKKQAWYEEVVSNLMSAEHWKALPGNVRRAPGMLGAAVAAAFGAGCTFDSAGLPAPDAIVQSDAARSDAGDAEVTDDGAVDGAIDGTTPVDGSPDTGTDATVPLGEPPRITWPKIAQLTNGIHMNNRIFWRLKLPLTSPAGKQIVGAEIDRSRNGSFVETIPVVLGHLRGSFDATQPFSSHELAARVIYDDATTSDSTALTVNVDSSLAFRLGMNENQGTTLQDSSVNAHDAEMVGGVNWIQDARGIGIVLAGAGYATFADALSTHLDFDWNQPFTIVADVNRGAENDWHAIYNRMDLDSGTARGAFFAFDDGNQLLLALNNDWASGIRLRANTSMATSITNMPSIVSVAYAGAGVVSDVMFTVNGDVESTNPIYDDLATSPTTIGVSSLLGAGLSSGTPTYGFNGGMYYMAVFKRSLSLEEQRHENCAYLDSIDASLPSSCD